MRQEDVPTSAADANATNVTPSGEALALLAAQETTKTFVAVTAAARVARDQLYNDANVTVPAIGRQADNRFVGVRPANTVCNRQQRPRRSHPRTDSCGYGTEA